MRYSALWYVVFALLALAWGALLVLSGCEDDGQCRPFVRVVEEGGNAPISCGPRTTELRVPFAERVLFHARPEDLTAARDAVQVDLGAAPLGGRGKVTVASGTVRCSGEMTPQGMFTLRVCKDCPDGSLAAAASSSARTGRTWRSRARSGTAGTPAAPRTRCPPTRLPGSLEMRAIIIEEKDALALLDSLKLTAMQGAGHFRADADRPVTVEEMHRAFNYVVVRWLQDQGASCVR